MFNPAMHDSQPMEKRFRVALSFPGEKRDFIKEVAQCLSNELGKELVLYDDYLTAELARPDLDLYLGNLYREQSDLLVPFYCADYERKKWCGLEWRQMRDILFNAEGHRIMPFRFDDAPITGVLSIDGYVNIDDRSPQEVAKLILQRLGRPQHVKSLTPLVSLPVKTKPRLKPLAKLCLALGLSIALALMLWSSFHQSKSSVFRILVADIDGPNNGLTGSLIEKLRNETRAYPDITILPANEKITPQDGPEMATKLALKRNADLVIWGRNPDSSDYATLYFQIRSPQIQTVIPALQHQTFRYSDRSIGTFAIQELVSTKAGSFALYVVAHRELFRSRNSEALQFLKQVIQLNPDNGGAHYLAGETLRILNRFDEAEVHYSKSILLHPKNPYAFLGRGKGHFSRRQLAKAVQDCSSAIQLQPNMPEAYRIRGDSYFQLGDITNAISDFTKSLSLRTNDPTVLLGRAVSHATLEDFSSAMSDIRAALHFSKDDYLSKSARDLSDALEIVLLHNDSLNRAIVGFEWVVTQSNNQTHTNHASGILILGAKAIYAVTSADVARQIDTNGFVLFCSASNRISKISITELGERTRTTPRLPLWFYEPRGGDCAAMPFLFGHSSELAQETMKRLEYINPVHLSKQTDYTNAPAVGDEITVCGINPAFDNKSLLGLAKVHSTVESGLSIDVHSNSFFLVHGSIPAHFQGGPVSQSLRLGIEMQMHHIMVSNVLDKSVSWGIAAKHKTTSVSENQTRVIHRAQIAEFIRGLENTITISWRTNLGAKKSI